MQILTIKLKDFRLKHSKSPRNRAGHLEMLMIARLNTTN